ncbi:5'-methylthioadenosine/S-adenosylhomocysteine nucleosidase family protein [Aspergillus undulatus]|uniref:5'-methylthioadenosine/S-adenosylhomocysteine nucleosidase family protein n=1 Tax=Aspergillus undulatus TaxID=1810928 RepID=UPI003CCDD34C
MDNSDVLDLGCQVLPWISNQLILIGQQTRNKVYGTLGCELFVLSQQVASISETASARQKLLKIFELVNKACSTSRNETDRFRALKRIRTYKDSTSKIRQTVIKETQESLVHFVLRNPEYHTLLRLIPDCLTVDKTEPLYTEGYEDDGDLGYPGHLNEMLYTQLQTYATCRCRTGHLEWIRLRLSTDSQNGDEDVSFELVFKANSFAPTHSQSFVQWKESNVVVPRRTDIQKQKKVGFATPPLERLSPKQNSSLAQRMRRLALGEFCKLIDDQLANPVQFYIQSNVLKVIETPNPNPSRGIFPCEGLSLGKWLEKVPHISNKGKSHLAYTIAKSVWQYYNSPWMTSPWTHENIQLLNEKTGLTGQGKPHPYLTTKLARGVVKSKDFNQANDLMHQYPHILSLGILLIEIAIKQPLASEEGSHPLSETKINDYYTWAWTTAQRSNLKDTVHSLYEDAVNNCLNPELFGGFSMEKPREVDEIRARQNALYEKIVVPLKRLSDAYRDDWDIPSLSTTNTTRAISHQVISNKTITASGSPLQADFTVAIFCALPLEVDAVSVLFDGFCQDSALYQNAPGDSNTYTLGQMGRHHAVLVHLPGMGKSVASQAASSIRSTYPNIKLALVVGVCGGVPYKNGHEEIILGDIVISDGIVQHDFGRRVPGVFLRKTSVTDELGRPNVAIRGFLSKIKTTMARKRIGSNVETYLKVINQALGTGTAQYPGIEYDELFQSTHRHKHHDPLACISCAHSANSTVCDKVFDLPCDQLKCHKDKLVRRKRLQTALTQGHTPSPTIHIGLIASGDTVMKSGQDRDLVAMRDNVLAFEMEGVGVWDSLPCLVVKGVCDYADSHKNKIWQPYAAATGAACMKALLDEWMF